MLVNKNEMKSLKITPGWLLCSGSARCAAGAGIGNAVGRKGLYNQAIDIHRSARAGRFSVSEV
ncbi:hypothetical protein GCM10009104_30450 [Marinobacterium maritimum]|uniref:Uncharacterized protein n=1 Tax=Marinobacterium maritimum TaxID=500162 RepID=A0ABN1I9C1_9GAMM